MNYIWNITIQWYNITCDDCYLTRTVLQLATPRPSRVKIVLVPSGNFRLRLLAVMKRKAACVDGAPATKAAKSASRTQQIAIKRSIQLYQELEDVLNQLLVLRRSGLAKSEQVMGVVYQIDAFEEARNRIVIASRAKEAAQLQELQNVQRLRIGALLFLITNVSVVNFHGLFLWWHFFTRLQCAQMLVGENQENIHCDSDGCDGGTDFV